MASDPIPGVSDSIREKAKRYLTDGKVQVHEAKQDPLSALVLVKGSGDDPYRVLINGRVVHCSCPARVWGCAHVVAALLVLEVTDPEQPDGFGSADSTIDALIEPATPPPPVVHDEGPLSSDDLDALLSM